MISVAAGLIIQTANGGSSAVRQLVPDRILLCQRKRGARYALKWEFPGGKVEKGESLPACLRRELLEELGIRAEIGELFHRQPASYPDGGNFDVSYFLVPSYTGTPANLLFETIRWVTLPELPAYDILEGNHDVVRHLVIRYGKGSPPGKE